MSAHPLIAREAAFPPVSGKALILDGFHVEGYGVWRDFEVALMPGLNVFYGPNEVGKSTLHAFLRHMLFGIPDGRFKESSHPPLGGGEHGGRLFLSRAGESMELRRLARGKKLSLVGRDGAPLSPSVLESWLLGIDAQLFRNLYAFGVEELAELDSLTGDAIGARLFDVGLEGAGRSVTSWLEELKKRREAELRPKSGAIRQLTKEAEAKKRELEQASVASRGYRQLLEKEERLQLELARLVEEERANRSHIDRGAALLASWPLELERREAEAILGRVGGREPLQPGTLERYDRVLADIERLSLERRGLEGEILELENAGRATTPDPLLAAIEGEARKALADVALQSERERRLQRLEAEIRDGEALLEERRARAAAFSPSAEAPVGEGPLGWAQVEAREVGLAGLRGAIARNEELSRRIAELQIAGGPLAGTQAWALGGAILLLLSGLWLLSGPKLAWGWVPLATGLVWSGLLYGAGHTGRGERRALRAQLEKERAEALGEIEVHSRSLGFGSSRPGTVEIEKLVASLGWQRRVVEVAASLAKAKAEAQGLRQEVGRWKRDVAELLSRSGRPWVGKAGLSSLEAALEEDQRKRSTRREVVAALEGLGRRLERIRSAEAEKKRELESVLADAGVPDREGLDEAHRASQARIDAERTLAEMDRLLLGNLGAGEEAAMAFEALRAGDKLSWERSIAEWNEVAEGLSTERLRLHEELALVRNEREVLEASTRIPELAREAAEIRSKLAASVERYRVAALVEHLLQATLERFQSERQPLVLRHAAQAFSLVTGGRYVSLRQRVGAREIEAVDRSGRTIPSQDLSRGTRDQLYLCLRLGLIEAFAERGTRLPLLMDDVLVHFDPARADAMAEVLAEVAKRHQLLFFTCHPQNVERLQRVVPGAHLVDLEGP